MPSYRNGTAVSSPTPGHPIHIPARPSSTGVSAVTKPPGLTSQRAPPSCSTRWIGNLLATRISWALLGLVISAPPAPPPSGSCELLTAELYPPATNATVPAEATAHHQHQLSNTP
jgi:hypothetical protein